MHTGLVKPSAGTRTLNWVTSEGIPFWSQLAWFVTLMCFMGPLLSLYAYDVWQKKKGHG